MQRILNISEPVVPKLPDDWSKSCSLSPHLAEIVNRLSQVTLAGMLEFVLVHPQILDALIQCSTEVSLNFELQVFAYAMISAGAAASGVTNLNRTGIHHTALPNFCKPLRSFCDHVAVSIFFTFFSCFLLAASAVQEVVWLSRSKY